LRVLITGGAGFIGSHLADELLAEHHHVTVLDNLQTGRQENVPDGAEWVEASITDRDVLRGVMADHGIDTVAHCAASYADRTDWTRDTQTNVQGTVNVVQLSEELGVQRLLYLQTALCYGHDPLDGLPSRPLPVDHPIRPDNSYAITKTAAERFIQHSSLDWVSLRLANVYGPRNLSGPIPTFYKRISEGQPCVVTDSRRDFVFIDDLLAVAVRALEGTGSGVYHVSSGTDYAIREAYEAVAAALGKPDAPVSFVPRPPDDAPSILLDPILTQFAFDWEPVVPFRTGIDLAVAHYRATGVDQTFTHLSLKG